MNIPISLTISPFLFGILQKMESRGKLGNDEKVKFVAQEKCEMKIENL